jgi:hypothetical protein
VAFRRGKAEVIPKLNDRMNRDIVAIGCGVHVMHKCVQSGCDMLSIELKNCGWKLTRMFTSTQ